MGCSLGDQLYASSIESAICTSAVRPRFTAQQPVHELSLKPISLSLSPLFSLCHPFHSNLSRVAIPLSLASRVAVPLGLVFVAVPLGPVPQKLRRTAFRLPLTLLLHLSCEQASTTSMAYHKLWSPQIHIVCLGSVEGLKVLPAKQLSVSEDYVLGAGHEVIFYPKFHCELNCIEYCWGAVKEVYPRTLQALIFGAGGGCF